MFVRYQDGAFHVTTFASPSAWHSFPFSPRALAINGLAWMLTAVLSISPRTTYIRLEVFLPINKLSETCPRIRQVS